MPNGPLKWVRGRNTLIQNRTFLFKCPRWSEFMDTGKIILFNLSDGILGERNSQLLGQLIVSKFQLAAMSRADIHQNNAGHLICTWMNSRRSPQPRPARMRRYYHVPENMVCR